MRQLSCKFRYVLVLVVLISITWTQSSYAFVSNEKTVENDLEKQDLSQNVKVVRDFGVKVSFDSKDFGLGDKGTLIYNGTTYLPVRMIAQSLGTVVDWNNETRTVILNTPSESELGQFDGKDYIDEPTKAIRKEVVREEVSWDGVQWKGYYTTDSALLTVGNESIKEGYLYNDDRDALLMYELNNNSDYMTFSVISDVYGEPDFSKPYTLNPVFMTVYGYKIGSEDNDALYGEDLGYSDHMVTRTINVTGYDAVLIDVYPGGMGHLNRAMIGDVIFTKDIEIPIQSYIDAIQDYNVSVNVDGKKINLEGNAPIIFEGTTYLPVRIIGESFGKVVEWDNDTRTVSLNHTKEQLEKINEEEKYIDSVFAEPEDLQIGIYSVDKGSCYINMDASNTEYTFNADIIEFTVLAESNIEDLNIKIYGHNMQGTNREVIIEKNLGKGLIYENFKLPISEFEDVYISVYTQGKTSKRIIIGDIQLIK